MRVTTGTFQPKLVARRLGLGLGIILAMLCCGQGQAEAKARKQRYQLSFPPPTASSIVLEAGSKQVLYENAADAHVRPASLTKMMTLYLTFGQLAAGKMHPEDALTVSRYAASRSTLRLGLRPGSTLTVAQAILGVITKSANDAAVVLAEAISGSEANFATLMNETARQIGMENTNFMNASGLPDAAQYTSARDMSTLSLALIYHYPQFYSLFATRRFVYGRTVSLNHNHLLGTVDGVDGIKTGFINSAGFNLAASAMRNNKRVVVIVMGGTSPVNRDRRVAELIDAGFAIINHEIDSLDESEPLSHPSVNTTSREKATPSSTSDASKPVLMARENAAAPFDLTPKTPMARAVIEDLTQSASPPLSPAPSLAPALGDADGEATVALPAATNNGGYGSPEIITASTIEQAAKANLTIPDSYYKPRRKKGVGVTKANAPSSRVAVASSSWAVQVGAFGSAPAARKAAKDVRKLSDAGSVKILPKKGRKPWRVRIIGLPHQQALDMCSSLTQSGHQCMVIPGHTG
ncbi:MAG: D-alanyl-D-alanine carboxypeptidase [Candidatus Symbiobacter sp.]|nr:D-alanyl-D-alanine carboxypeptidase [Candidatus Symbiobacter sp.]